MKRFYSKMLAFILAVSILTMLLIGCSKEEKKSVSAPSPDAGKQQAAQSSAAPSTKIVDKPLTLKYWSPVSQKVSDTTKNYNELAPYIELEKRTGIHIDFQHPAFGQEKEQFNLMMASNDLPDLIWYTWTDIPGGPAKAISDKAIIKLNDVIDKNAPNLKKVFEKYPDSRKDSMLDDGTFYMLPFIKPDKAVRTVYGPQFRKDWLDKLQLKVPTTIDEFYNVLKAFAEKDPNGNGQKDEIPFVSQKLNEIKYLSAAWGIDFGMYKDGNTVKYGPAEPAYKNYVTAMRQWFKEGLIDPDFLTNDAKQFDAKITGNKAGSFYGLASGNMGRYMNLMLEKDPKYELAGATWPIGPAGKAYNTHTDAVKPITGPGLAITTKNKNVTESVKWCDYQYGEEGTILMNFGIEGESYKMVNGNPVYTDLILKNPKGLTPDQAVARYATTFGATNVYDSRYIEQIMVLPQQKNAMKAWAQGDTSLTMPNITPTAEESSKLASIINEANTYRDEMFGKFILGQESLDNFDKYVQTLKSMKIDDAIKVYQAALDRYNNRK